MDKGQFAAQVRSIVEKCLPDEIEMFDVASEDVVGHAFANKPMKSVASGGDSEFIDVENVKMALEFVPLVYACYSIVFKVSKAVRSGLGKKPNAEELKDMLVRGGCSEPVATRAVAQCRAELEQLVLTD